MMTQTVGSINVSLRVKKRWFFQPALIAIVLLGHAGILRDQRKAAKWLADRAIRFEVV